MDWVRFPLALWYRTTRGMTDAEKGALMDKTVDALVDGLAGVSTIADKILDETNAYIEKSKEMGRMGGLKKAQNAARRRAENNSTPPSEILPPLEKRDEFLGSATPPRNFLPIHTYKQTDKQTDIKETPSGFLPAHTREEAGATPAPPANAQGEPRTRLPSSIRFTGPALPANLDPGLAARLAEAMKAAPLSVAEALDYASGCYCGLTPPQVLEWAEWNAERGWARDSGGNLHPLTADGAKTSMRRWKNRQPEIERLRKAREARTGGAAGGDETIRGVRVANKGDDLGDWGK